MANELTVPGANTPIANPDGTINRIWWRIFVQLSQQISSAGVTTFNGRSGAVTLNSSDIDAALGFVPGTSKITQIDTDAGLTGGPIFEGEGVIGIADAGVTYAKIQDTSADTILIGRSAGSGAGSVEEITLGSGLSMTGSVLSATATGSGGSYVPLVTGAEPPVLVSDGMGRLIFVDCAP